MVDVKWPVEWCCVPCGHKVAAKGPGKEFTPDVCPECDGNEWTAAYSEEFFKTEINSDKPRELEFEGEYIVRITKYYGHDEFNVAFFDDEEKTIMDLFRSLGFEDAVFGDRIFDTGYGFGEKPFRDWFIPTLEEQFKRGMFDKALGRKEEEE
jgi:hypothetical protein